MTQYYEILTKLGYNLKDCGSNWRTRPLYRESDNDTVLKINKKNGRFVDFARGINGDFQKLISLTIGEANTKDLKELSELLQYNNEKCEEIRVSSPRQFDMSILNELKQDYTYWNGRNINNGTLKRFSGGICETGRMKNRFVFPIFNETGKIIGLSGRDVSGKAKFKWKHLGDKKNWCFPRYQFKDNSKVYLVESIGDMLRLYQCGEENVIVTFGLFVSNPIRNLLIRINPKTVVISFNNDIDKKENRGKQAALSQASSIARHFDDVQVKLPWKGDLGEMEDWQVKKWLVE